MSESTFAKLRAHRERLASAGYKRVFLHLSAESRRLIAANRQPGESPSGTLNRLLSAYPPSVEEWPQDLAREIQHAINQMEHTRRPGSDHRTLSVTIYRADRSGCVVHSDGGVEFFDRVPP